MFDILILVCAVSMPVAECQRDTARTVTQGPSGARSEELCGLYGQAYIAELALELHPADDEYLKIICTRSSIGSGSVG